MMTQAIYTSVNNEVVKQCNPPIRSDKVPLMKDKFLGEFRTEAEKAKARKNLGVASVSYEGIYLDLDSMKNKEIFDTILEHGIHSTYCGKYNEIETLISISSLSSDTISLSFHDMKKSKLYTITIIHKGNGHSRNDQYIEYI